MKTVGINSDLYKRYKHRKEELVRKLLENKIDQKMYSYDRTIDTQCSNKRPDIVYECKTHFLVIEIDENQHKTYEKECEDNRMKEITIAFGMPTIFLRYNPDDYKVKGEIIDKDMNKRHKNLIGWVNHLMTESPKDNNEFLRVKYLYYDEYKEKDKRTINIKML